MRDLSVRSHQGPHHLPETVTLLPAAPCTARVAPAWPVGALPPVVRCVPRVRGGVHVCLLPRESSRGRVAMESGAVPPSGPSVAPPPLPAACAGPASIRLCQRVLRFRHTRDTFTSTGRGPSAAHNTRIIPSMRMPSGVRCPRPRRWAPGRATRAWSTCGSVWPRGSPGPSSRECPTPPASAAKVHARSARVGHGLAGRLHVVGRTMAMRVMR